MPPLRKTSRHAIPAMELLDPVVNSLIEPEKKRLNQDLQMIIVKNHALGGTRDAFYAGGDLVSLSAVRIQRKCSVKPIHESLVPEFEPIRQLQGKLSNDTRRLRQSLAVVLARCRTRQDIRDALPDALAILVPDLRGIDRLNSEGFPLEDNPMLHAQFQEAIDIALYYTANRLVF